MNSVDPLMPEAGLSQADAKTRLDQDGPNTLPGSKPKSLWLIARNVLMEPMFLMLLVAGGLYLVLGDLAEAMFLMASVLVIIGITLVQERKTQRALEALRDLSAPQACVIRDGKEARIPSAEVVMGDILSLREGDRIAADARLLSGHLEADESLLTGESVPVRKVPGADAGEIFAGTVVTKGRGTAQVTATATATALGHIGQALSSTVEVTSGLQRASRRLVRIFAMAAVLCAISLWLINWLWDNHSLVDSLLSGIALAMAILPEEFPVILTVFLALGAWRISRQKVLTRRVSAVEALGAITVLAVDKTGTLTQNRMQIAELFSDGQSFLADQATLPAPFQALMRFALLATPGDSGDPMEQAIRSFGANYLEPEVYAKTQAEPAKAYALEPELLAMTRAFRQAPDQPCLFSAKGAPEAIIDLCRLEPAEQKVLIDQVQAMAERGLRVIAVAEGSWTDEDWPATQRGLPYRFVGLVGLMDPPRPEASAAIAECHAAGIRIIMMTGDHQATAQAIAVQVGLSSAPELITGKAMEALDDAQLGERLRYIDVCARVQPTQKLRLVKLLQEQDEIVGMTGDGVNDAPALKAANVGVAMGERGTDVAREAAALVLLDDNFASLVVAVRQGRSIYDNITKATRFVVAVHVPIVALALVPSLLHWPILLMPVQIVLLELLIDPACSIVFESAKASPTIMQRPPRPIDESPFRGRNLVYGILQGLGLGAILLLGYAFALGQGLGTEQGRAAVFAGLIVTVFLLTLANHDLTRALWRGKFRENPWLLRMFGGVGLMLAGIMSIPPLRHMMGFGSPHWSALVFGLAILAGCVVWLEAVRRVTRHTSLAVTE